MHCLSCSTRGPKEAKWWTDTPTEAVQLRYGKTGAAAEPAETVVDLFEGVVSRFGKKTALAVKRAGEWKTWTYEEYRDEARLVAKAFIQVRLNLVSQK